VIVWPISVNANSQENRGKSMAKHQFSLLGSGRWRSLFTTV